MCIPTKETIIGRYKTTTGLNLDVFQIFDEKGNLLLQMDYTGRLCGSNNGGNPATVSNFQLTGWGSGAAVSAVRGKDSSHVFTVTVGASPSENPSILYTYASGPYDTAPIYQSQIRGGTAQVTDLQIVESTSAYVLTLLGFPVQGTTYIFSSVAA